MSGNVLLDPSKRFWKVSNTCNDPTDQPLKLSLEISLIVILNSCVSTKLDVVGMPADPVRDSVSTVSYTHLTLPTSDLV